MNMNLFDTQTEWRNLFAYEAIARHQGYGNVAGIDEAGRGPLAGPVVAAAVILPYGLDIPSLDDSKKLSAKARNSLFEEINAKAIAVGTGVSDHLVIDRINILQATLRAMGLAVKALSVQPDFLIIDGINTIHADIPQKAIKKGDSLSASIAAASIVAKVTRDRMMAEYDLQYPEYGFSGHKGYGSAAHLAAVAKFGPCPIHRKSFRGVKEHLDLHPATLWESADVNS